jgi:SAM-dependent methyltransferase
MKNLDKKIFLNLGAGSDIKVGYINHDIVALPDINVVHNLNHYPWPWDNNSIDEVQAVDLLEHLDDFILAMEELYRIIKPGGSLYIKVPYWNSAYTFMDPTHKRGFHENTFHFFDPSKELCQLRHYYSHARFIIESEVFVLLPFAPYLKIPFVKELNVEGKLLKRVVGFFGNLVSNIILDLKITMTKPTDSS